MGVQTGLGRGLAVKLRSGKVQVKSGLVQFWFRQELKFNSLELDSEVGRLVKITVGPKYQNCVGALQFPKLDQIEVFCVEIPSVMTMLRLAGTCRA